MIKPPSWLLCAAIIVASLIIGEAVTQNLFKLFATSENAWKGPPISYSASAFMYVVILALWKFGGKEPMNTSRSMIAVATATLLIGILIATSGMVVTDFLLSALTIVLSITATHILLNKMRD